MAWGHVRDHLPGQVQSGVEVRGPVAHVVVRRPFGTPGINGSTGAVVQRL